MKYGLFGCCAATSFLKQFESSIGAVLEKSGIEFVRLKDLNCCGYPLRNVNFKMFILSSARNLALVEKKGLDLITICNCCYGTLKYVKQYLKEDTAIGREVRESLNSEGLSYGGKSDVKHVLEVLHHHKDAITQKMTARLDGLKVALQYGCHILRPRQLVTFEPVPSMALCDQLIDLTGAERVAWKEMLQCCGAPVVGIDDALSKTLLEKKLSAAAASGADCLCTICPFCQIQFNGTKTGIARQKADQDNLPSLSYIQLLGLCLGVEADILGLDRNQLKLVNRVPVANSR